MWECAIEGCGRREAAVEDLLVHQASDHERVPCEVCGSVVPDGYFAVRHALDHGRAEYVRAYDASSTAVREREDVVEAVEDAADLQSVLDRLEAGGESV
jgi:hypothetical protein